MKWQENVDKSDDNKHTNKYYGRFKGSIEKKESKDKSEDTDSKDNKNNNIQTTAWNRFKKKEEIKEINNEQNKYTQSIEFKALATGNIKTSEGNNSVKKGRFGFGLKDNSIDDKNNKSNSESKLRFGYKSKKFNARDKTEDLKDENTGNKFGNKIEKKETQSSNGSESNSQISKKLSLTKKYKSSRFNE